MKAINSSKIGLKQNGRFYYGWILAALSFILMILVYVGAVSITSIFVVPVTEALGVDRGEFLLYQTILCLASVLVTAYFGKKMDTKWIKPIMAISSILAAISYIIFAVSSSIIWFYVFSVFIGAAFANSSNLPISVIMNNWFGGKIKATVMGFTFIGSGIGGLTMLPVINFFIMKYGYQAGYIALAIGYTIAALLILLLVVRTPEEKGFVRMGEDSEEKQSSTVGEKSGISYKEARKLPSFWLMVISCFFCVIGSSAILFSSAPYYMEVGFTADKAALIASVNLGMLAIGKPTVGFMCDKLGGKAGTLISTTLFAICFLFLAIMHSNPTLFIVLFVITYGIGGGTLTVSLPNMVNAMFGEKEYGRIVSANVMAANFGGAIGGTIAGYIFDITGSYVTFWWIAFAVVTTAAIFRLIAFRSAKSI